VRGRAVSGPPPPEAPDETRVPGVSTLPGDRVSLVDQHGPQEGLAAGVHPWRRG
jgi:hypothetical protein